MRIVRNRVGLAALAAGLVLGSMWSASASEKGKQLYVKHGCWQCHGFVGQGGVAGPALVPKVMPLEAMTAFVRNSARAMPPYREDDSVERGHERDPRLSGVDPAAGRRQGDPAAQSVSGRFAFIDDCGPPAMPGRCFTSPQPTASRLCGITRRTIARSHRASVFAMISSQRLPASGSATEISPENAALSRFEGKPAMFHRHGRPGKLRQYSASCAM